MKNNKGITLIALIITIIVMLILVAISVSVIVRGDLLGTAKNATTSYKDEEKVEKVQQFVLGKYNLSTLTLPTDLGTIVLDEKTYSVTAISGEATGESSGITIRLTNTTNNADIIDYDLKNQLRINMGLEVENNTTETIPNGTYWYLGNQNTGNSLEINDSSWTYDGMSGTYSDADKNLVIEEEIILPVTYEKNGENWIILINEEPGRDEWKLYATANTLNDQSIAGTYNYSIENLDKRIILNASDRKITWEQRVTQDGIWSNVSGDPFYYAIYDGKIWTDGFGNDSFLFSSNSIIEHGLTYIKP